ncbi:MAG TPA: BamA/TamA family outer membrane protein [Vicinamibacteria bacterium]|nr:BamA/TamA family outer membrane protein [Vicinamibacteria bacterium]
MWKITRNREARAPSARWTIGLVTLGLCFASGATSMALCQSPAEIPPSRAAELTREREEKATKLQEPDPSGIENGLHWWDNQQVINRVLSGWHGFHVATGSFANGAGLTFGAGYRDLAVGSVYPDDDLPNRVDFTAVGAYSTRNYFLARSGVAVKNLGSAPVDISVWGRIYEFPEEDFFGLGAQAEEANRTAYQMNSSEFVVDGLWRAGGGFQFGGSAAYLNPRIGEGQDPRYPSTEEVFDPATIPGYTEQPNFLRFTGDVAYEYRDNPSLPRRGGLYRLRYLDYQDQDLEAYDFRQLQADAEQYFPLGHKFRVLALRAAAVISDTDSGQEVPFYYQPTLGGGQRLRGFREFRFRDRNAMLFTAEYRWQAWWALDMALFADAGKVAYDRDDLDFNDLEASYGLGFRFHSNDAFTGRLDLAFSREGFIPFLSFVYVF